MSGGIQHHHQIDATDQRCTAQRLTTRHVEARGSNKGWPRAATIEIDPAVQTSAPPCSALTRVAARGRKMNGPCRAPSRQTTSFAAASSPHAAATVGRVRTHLIRPATSKLHVDDLLGHDATCMGAGCELVGLPLIFDRLDHVGQDPSPITTHRRRPLAQAPRLDGRNMRAATFRRTENSHRGFYQ